MIREHCSAYKVGRESSVKLSLSQDSSLPRGAGEADLERRKKGRQSKSHIVSSEKGQSQPAYFKHLILRASKGGKASERDRADVS